jgi:hypothetical protein
MPMLHQKREAMSLYAFTFVPEGAIAFWKHSGSPYPALSQMSSMRRCWAFKVYLCHKPCCVYLEILLSDELVILGNNL